MDIWLEQGFENNNEVVESDEVKLLLDKYCARLIDEMISFYEPKFNIENYKITVLSLVRNGLSFEDALEEAWSAYNKNYFTEIRRSPR